LIDRDTVGDWTQARREDQAQPISLSPSAIVLVCMIMSAILLAALTIFSGLISYDAWVALFVGPVLFLLALPAIARQAKREQSRRLFMFLAIALALHLAMSALAHYFAFNVYKGVVDATDFDLSAIKVANGFRHGHFATGLDGFTGNNLVIMVNAIFYTLLGPTSFGSFLLYAWFGFWGEFYFYRAFTLAVPEGRRRTYAKLLFLLPSQLFWTSYMGKDAWMVMGLGIATFGVARLLTGARWKGLAAAILGVLLMNLVRPHVAGMLGLGIFAAYLIRRPPERLRQLAPVVKVIGILIFAVFSVFLLKKTQSYLQGQGIETNQGVTRVLEEASLGGASGGSEFTPPIVRSPKDLPYAAVTVLFRPFPTEAKGAVQLVAGTEGAFLLVLSLLRIRWGLSALRSIRRQPMVAIAVVYTGAFTFAFSSFANFGLLNRQRVQLLPFYLILLCIPPQKKEVS
jgi:hypothetical protein